MSLALARTLVLTEIAPWSVVAQALLVSSMRNISLVRALLDAQLVPRERLEEELARADAPVAETVVPDGELVGRLPRGLCTRFYAVPLRRAGVGVDVAFADARDTHAVRELTYHLKAPVRVLRAPLAKIEEAVSKLPAPRREDSMVESTLVSVRAPEGLTPPSDRGPPSSRGPVSGGGSGAPIPLVRNAGAGIPAAGTSTGPGEQPIPLVRRSEPEPVLELRSPYSRHGGRAIIESTAMGSMRGAPDRDAILRLLLEGASEHAKRVILFAVRKDAFTGLSANKAVGNEARVKETRVPAEVPSIFATVHTGGSYVGPIYTSEAHKPLLALLPGVEPMVGVIPVRLRGRPLVLVVADGMNDPAADVRHIEELARSAGEAFARILAAKGE